MGRYDVVCIATGKRLEGPSFDFLCPKHNSLARTVYTDKRIKPKELHGIWRYIDWLPVKNPSTYTAKPLTYRSEGLADELGLSNLFVSFNGYWPEGGVKMETCTFKELEGAVTIQYAKEHGVDRLVVASAGNTAKAFALTAIQERFQVVLIVPEKCLCGVNLPRYDERYVKTLMLTDGDYSDAIRLSERVSKVRGFANEGGARNVSRRDGLGVVMLDAVMEMGRLPDHYFQAVGSGTGAIAAYEAVIRFIGDGRFGSRVPRFHLSQNMPVAPMYNAWKDGRREIDPVRDLPKANNILDLVYARVLTNRYPPYGVVGGVYDTLTASKGVMYGVENKAAREARRLFKKCEDIDILPAAAVAVSSLQDAIEAGSVERDSPVMLNITGGGNLRLRKDMKLERIKEDYRISKDISDDELRGLEL